MERHIENFATRGSGRQGITAQLRRAVWSNVLAFVAVGATLTLLPLIALFGASSGVREVVGWLIGLELLVAALAVVQLARQVFRHARALEQQQALLDAALASAPVGFGFFDRNLRYLRVNETLARINGRPAEAHVGGTLSDFDPTLASSVSAVLRRVLDTRQPVSNVETRGRTAGSGGEVHSWLTNFYPIITPTGELFGAGVVVTDVTELKRLEEQLFQAQKMEAVGRLAGGVAHDFNNLLTVINSYAELMLADPARAGGYGEAEEIRAAAIRAARLTRQLLAFSRRQAMEARLVNPNDVLRGVETLLRQLVLGRVEIITDLSPDTPLVCVDPGQLEQVVMNLAINAADAMPNGGELRIETSSAVLGPDASRRDHDLAPGEYAVIRVSDTGHGMDEATATQAFEPFFTTKEPGRGTGLGLSTAYGIVKQFDGNIELASEVGVGTVFTVYLPCAPLSAPTA